MQTFGWDTVFVIDVGRVNAALAAHSNELLLQFDASLGEEMNVSAVGKFRPWEVVKGGAAKILYVQMPIQEGTLTVGENFFADILEQVPDASEVLGPELFAEAMGGLPRSADLAGISVVMAVALSLLPRFSGPNPSGDFQDLRFDIRGVGSGTPAPGLLTPVNVIDPDGRLTNADKGLLLATLAQYLAANAGRLSYIFATINLVPPASNSWLAPVASDYAYLDKIDVGSYMAVLSVVEERDISGLSRSIDPDAIKAGMTGSYLISRSLFLRRVIQPYLPAAYHTGAESFGYNAGEQALRNTRAFQTASIKVGAITYYPKINYLAVTTTGEGVSTHVEGDCSLYAGISMTFRVRTKNKVVFNPTDKTVSFLPDPNPDSSHTADIPWYFWFIGLIARGITELIVQLIAKGLASALDQLASQALTIARNPPQSIRWENTSALDVSTAGVNDSFYMMGQL